MPKTAHSILTRARPALASLALVAVVSGCASPPSKTLSAETALERWSQPEPAVAPTVPEAVSQALFGQAPAAREPERFDVSVRNMPAQSFFLGLVDGTNVNVVVHPNVSGSISLNLRQVTVEDVLKVTRDIYGYEYQQTRDNIYTIYPRELRTQVFQVNYLDVQRVGVSDTGVLIGRSEASSNALGAGGARSSGDDSANLLALLGHTSSGANSGSQLTPGARVQTLNRTDFWQSLQQTVSAMIGGDQEERMVMVSPQAGMLVVKALPHELNAVRDFLERSELSVKRQVILEAKIIEVRLNEGFEAGINWGAISGELAHQYSNRRTSGFERLSELGQALPGGAVAGALTESDSRVRGSDNLFTSVLRVGDITELLSLLETQGNVQVLSSPRVSTVNNQKALIRVGTDEYFITGISTNTTANIAAVSSTPNIELSSFFSGIALDVTPQIGSDGDVILHIHPVVSEVQDQLKVFTIGDERFALPLAQRGVRESDSIVRARSGQVVVLGGLMQETIVNVDGKRPVLGDIPLINSLFKTKSQRVEKTELVILLRPLVVDENTWQQSLEQSREQMRLLGDSYRQMIGE